MPSWPGAYEPQPRKREVLSGEIGELIAAALDETLPPGTMTKFPMNLAKSELIPSGRRNRPYGTFNVIDGGKK